MANPIYGRKFPRRVLNESRFVGGIADFDKEGGVSTYAFGRSVDFRTDPRLLTLLPATVKESGTVVTDLPKWGERVTDRNTPTTSNTFVYGNVGNIYKRTSSGVWTNLRTVSSSHGNGMAYFGEDDYLYYASDKLIGRYGPVSGTPSFVDDYFGTQGGIPTNTFSLSLASASSQYASHADAAGLRNTSDTSMEIYAQFTTLPTVGNSMTMMGKWDESGATRCYKFDVNAVSGYFGDGSDGALTISADTTEAPIDSACSGTAGAQSLTATNASFAQNQVIYIHQTQGTNAGQWERNIIAGYTAGTITLANPLVGTYGTGAQVRVLKQYSSVTINSGKTYTAKAWNGTVGGILGFLCSGTATVTGTITASGKGFAGGAGGTGNTTTQFQGDGTAGVGVSSTSANGNGGGGGKGNGGGSDGRGSGGGGGNGASGQIGNAPTIGTPGAAGASAGSTDLTNLVFGGGGGGANGEAGAGGGAGGAGGGILFLVGATITITGTITANGAAGSTGGGFVTGGGGAGGSILLKTQTGTLGASLITATGGSGTGGDLVNGGNGGDGRGHLDYYTSYTGTFSVGTGTATYAQDNNLVTTTSYQLRLGISNDGTANEYLTKNFPVAITTGLWYRFGVSWVASTSTATFYQNGNSLGTTVGTKTAISNNGAAFAVGANKTASAYANFFNGLLDDARLWNTTRSASQMLTYKDVELSGSESGLTGYWKFNNDYSDTTSNANTLTATGAPTFSTTVPFPNPTTRLDIDQSAATNGFDYDVPTAISEGSTERKSFVPAKDPQKSIDVLIAAKGTGNVTLTVHDGLNNQIATATIATASVIASAYNEFTYSSVWRPIIGATYHFHVTSTVNDTTITCGTDDDMTTISYHSYYQFLVNDSDFHPIRKFLNLIAIGNERYLATYDASTYTPHKIKLPSGHRIRALAEWREYLAIGCWFGSVITDYDYGRIFFWDGYSTTYNFYIDVPEGGINAMWGTKGKLHIIAGYKGDHLTYTGGDEAVKERRFPKMTIDKYMEVFPGAVTMWQALLRFGVAGNSDSAVIEKGVYTYGAYDKGFTDALSYDYPISTGNRLSTVTIGMLMPVDKKLLIGWQDGISYGVDVVNPAGSVFATGTIEELISDWGILWKEKQGTILRADFKPLLTGENIDIKYKLNRATSWTNLGTTSQVVGDTSARLPIQVPNGRFHEIQVAADLSSSVATSPTLLELSFETDFLLEEDYK